MTGEKIRMPIDGKISRYKPPKIEAAEPGVKENPIEATNTRSKPFVWTKTADEIFASVGRFCKLISDSGH
jgi:hypothetical protein